MEPDCKKTQDDEDASQRADNPSGDDGIPRGVRSIGIVETTREIILKCSDPSIYHDRPRQYQESPPEPDSE